METIVTALILIIGIATLVFIAVLIMALMKISGESDKDDVELILQREAEKGIRLRDGMQRRESAEDIQDRRQGEDAD